MSADVEVVLRLKLAEIFRRVQEATKDGLEEVLLIDVLTTAVELSPKKTGTNARSIEVETEINSKGEVEGTLFTQSGYGGYLEVGTSKMPARPYLFPAFELNREKILKAIKRRIP